MHPMFIPAQGLTNFLGAKSRGALTRPEDVVDLRWRTTVRLFFVIRETGKRLTTKGTKHTKKKGCKEEENSRR